MNMPYKTEQTTGRLPSFCVEWLAADGAQSGREKMDVRPGKPHRKGGKDKICTVGLKKTG